MCRCRKLKAFSACLIFFSLFLFFYEKKILKHSNKRSKSQWRNAEEKSIAKKKYFSLLFIMLRVGGNIKWISREWENKEEIWVKTFSQTCFYGRAQKKNYRKINHSNTFLISLCAKLLFYVFDNWQLCTLVCFSLLR